MRNRNHRMTFAAARSVRLVVLIAFLVVASAAPLGATPKPPPAGSLSCTALTGVLRFGPAVKTTSTAVEVRVQAIVQGCDASDVTGSTAPIVSVTAAGAASVATTGCSALSSATALPVPMKLEFWSAANGSGRQVASSVVTARLTMDAFALSGGITSGAFASDPVQLSDASVLEPQSVLQALCASPFGVASATFTGGLDVRGCSSHADLPDLSFTDSNCDGIDGTVSDAIFVSIAGDDSNPGTEAAPVRTISHAVAVAAAAGKSEVLVAQGVYGEGAGVDLSDGVGIYGGYADGTWTRSLSNTTTIVGGRGAISAVDVNSTLQLLDVTGVTPSSGSTYGIRASGSTLQLQDVIVDAQAGAIGTDGSLGANGVAGAAGQTGGTGSCNVTLSAGGGVGGTGDPPRGGGHGGAGGAGSVGAAGFAGGVGGFGGVGGAQGDPGQSGAPGGSGAPGSVGSVGSAGSGGVLSSLSWVTGAGGAGGTGGDGNRGGGGGGGGRFKESIVAAGTGNGGGGGGAGGAAAAGGTGGAGGGASIGILAVGSSNIVLSDGSAVLAAAGGAGGAGASGGSGGPGGPGGAGGNACLDEVGAGGPGGPGGHGGAGGAGGGGAGGSSFGVLLDDTSTATGGTITPGSAGTGGAGAAGSPSGANGVSAAISTTS